MKSGEQLKKMRYYIKNGGETERGWRRPPRGGSPPGPPRKEGPPSRTPPSKPLKPVTPAAAPTLEPTPPTTKAPSQPKAQPQVEEIYPVEMLERQVKEHLEQVRKAGGIPSLHQPFLTAYLRQKGVSKEEISKMTPQEAWAKAEEILPETPPPSPVTLETRKEIPKREYRRRKKQKKRRREEEEE